MNYQLPSLPYEKDALEPVISEKTMEFHYGKHHQGYVNKLNNLTENTKWEEKSLEELIREAEGGIYNNAAQVWNHTFFWESMTPGGKEPGESALKDEISKVFGSLEDFKKEFEENATSLFGSGWVWLVKDKSGKLKIFQGANAENPLREGHTPLLTFDVWEHAYYLDYQNKRAEFAEKFWDVVDWNKVEERYNS